jgi:hypothetical protein
MLTLKEESGGEAMGPKADISKQLQDFMSETSKQIKELRREVAELKKQQADILTELRSPSYSSDAGEKNRAKEEKVQIKTEKGQTTEGQGQAIEFKMYCTQCLEMKTIAAPKRVMLPDGSMAIQGRCADCGTAAFRMIAMSGTLMDRAAAARLGSIQD